MIKWGLIGCGDVVETKSGRPFQLDGKSTIQAVMSRNLDKAKDFAARYDVPEYFDDAAQLIHNPNVDAVYVATPPSTHMPYAKMALEAGKPVYVEKPMGTAYADCVEVVELAKEKDIPLFVAYYRRCLPYYLTVKKMLDDGEIGQVRSVNVLHYMPPKKEGQGSAWQRDPILSGGGLFYDVSCHALDVLDFMMGPITEVYGDSQNMRNLTACDDTVACYFKFKNGAIGTGVWCFDAGTYLERIQVIGDKGQIEFHIHNDTIDLMVNGEHKHMQIQHPEFIQECMIHNVIETLNGQAEAASTGESALRTARIMEIVAKGANL